MKEWIVNSQEETKQFAYQFATQIKPGDIIAYHGGMGAGKTTFTRYLLEGLDYIGEVTSPTFAIVNEYQTKVGLIQHYDMYRIHSEDDLYTTGFYDELGKDSILLIEWSENIKDELPENTIYLTLEPLSENSRKITIDGGEDFENSFT